MKEAKKKALHSPLALLEEMSHSLLAHLEQACGDALVNTQKQLQKLDRQLEKLQARLEKRLLRLDEAISAGRMKARSKLTTEIAAMEALLAELQQDRAALVSYMDRLTAEISHSLQLGGGITKVAHAAAAALGKHGKSAPVAPAEPEPAPAAQPAAAPPAAASEKPAAAPARRRRSRPASAAGSTKTTASAKPAGDSSPAPADKADAPAGTERPARRRRRAPVKPAQD